MKITRVSDAIARSFRLRLCHLSDTHGGFPRLDGRFDAVIHTGDFFPNSQFVMSGQKKLEADFQLQWLETNVRLLKKQLQGHPYFFILGNHDFADPALVEKFLREEGIKAFDLTDKVVSYQQVNFYGFPYIPAIGGNVWNYECEIPEMQVKVDEMVKTLNTTKVDVLAAHAPMHKCLDLSYSNEILGSTVIANGMDYKLDRDMCPDYYFHGHIHESHGISMRNNMLVSNAAVTYQIIEI